MARLRSRRQQLFSILSSGCLLILLCAQFIGSWPFAAPAAFAASKPPVVPGHLTLQQFLREGTGRRASAGSFSFPTTPPQVTLAKGEHLANYAHLPPSAQPPTMKPLTATLSAAFLAGRAGTQPLALVGSDHHLEVQLAPGSLDLSHASVTGTGSGSTASPSRHPAAPTATPTGATASPAGTPTPPPSAPPPPSVSGPLTLKITQVQGIFVGQVSLLAQYRFQITTAHGQVVSGITLTQPMTLMYHYDPAVLASLDFDPGALYATWPALINAARAARQPTASYTIPLRDDPKTHTLTGQSQVLVNGLLDDGNGNPANQAPPTPLVAAMQGNSGQLSYSYPLVVAPGLLGTMPNLNLVYSSQATNERNSQTAPANDFGEGWSLSLGSISADEYPAGSAGGQATWYSLSGVDNISDLLVPNPKDTTQFLTEHLSYLRIRQVTANGQPCFDVWDTGGTEYIFGCTSDSLQYYTTSDGTRHNYRWDLDDVIPANEGPNTDTRFIQVSYLQNSANTNGYTSIRDAVIKQITYGIQGQGFLSGTIDFSYQAPFSDPPWTTAYSGSCAPLRCDDPTNYSGGLNAPLVMTTFTLVSVTSYVGTDGSSSNKDYSYAFSYGGSGEQACTDDYSGLSENCAGEHLLQSVTPTVYQNGSGTRLPGLSVAYNGGSKDDYTDTTQTVPGGGNYSVKTFWDYLAFYDDLATGVGATITYLTSYNNSDGTPETSQTENRYDALYCSRYACSGNYDHPSDRAWSAQVVTSITALGSDSSAQSPATTSYAYRLAKTGTYQGPPSQLCYPAGSDSDCVGDTWQPAGDGDWLDYYHSEFRGFAEVDILSPADELTVQTYASTDGWGQPESNAHDYTAGALNDEKIYQGANTSAPLLQETQNIYAGYQTLNGVQTDNSCNGSYSGTYPPCEVFLITSRTTEYDGSSSSSAPWVEQELTYDDYSPTGGGLVAGYHNLDAAIVSSSNTASITQHTTYQVTDTTLGGWVYYNIHEPVHSEIDDSSGHVWACQDMAYDEGVQSGVPTPDAGWLTTIKTYSDCANQSNTAITAYTGYDVYGNPVVSVDGVGVANGTFYSSQFGIQGKNGCSLGEYSPLAIMNPAWGSAFNYTTCTQYDDNGLPATFSNAFNQSTTTTYDPTQGDLLTGVEDANLQTTHYTYSYPGGDPTVQTSEPGDTPPSYTTQSQSVSNCTGSSTLPCFQINTQSSSYPYVSAATFYDAMGRPVETITPISTLGSNSHQIILSKIYELVQFTVYDDAAHSVFQSQPFTVAVSGLSDTSPTWVDPNNVTDYKGNKVYGTATFSDALGRPIAEQDPAFGSGQAQGNPCPPLIINNAEANATDCAIYKLDTVSQIPQDSSDTNTYAAVESIDPDNHVSESYSDSLGNTRYVISYSGNFSNTLTPNEQVVGLYNALNEPINVTTTDLAPLNNQSISSVTTTMQYDDLGRLVQQVDPDRGTHTYTYDPDGQLLDDTSGNRTIGYNYDLLGRVGCGQSGAVTSDADGSCTTPNNAIIQNTYDTTEIGTQGSTDFPVGRLTKTQATTAYPEGGSTQSTEKFQYDPRGRVTTEQLKFNLPSSWNVSNALPTYQMAFLYNDADQLTTSTSSAINGQGQSTPGYSTYQNYDPNTGVPIGLSTQTSSTPTLAALTYNSAGLVSNLTFQNGAGTEQAAETFSYDGDLRPSEDTATWQSGSGQSGQFFDETRSFDQASNLVSQTTTLAAVTGLSSTGGSETNNYCYDEQNRLVWASNSQQPSPTGSESCGSATAGTTFSAGSYTNTFSYTHLGQLWHAPVNGTGGYQQYLYCNSAAPHQLTNIVPAGQGYSCSNLPATSTYAVGYDNWGNVTSRTYNSETATLSYNKLDEMVEWQIPSTNQAWYAYDSSGERTLQRTTIGSTTTMTVYAFGLEEYNYDGSGNLQSSTHYYTLGGRLLGELQTSGSASTTNYFLTDNLGSVLAVFNSVSSSAALLSTQLYAPYGASRFTAGTPGNYTSKGYTGQYNDNVSGLDYYNARYYDPVSGVFLSADTVEGNDSGMNPYAYAGGNPITRNDPTGHDYPSTLQKIAQLGTRILIATIVVGFLTYAFVSKVLQPKSGPSYPANGPQPTPTPTPTTATTPEPTPQTSTNGAMCKAGGCYDLTKDEGTTVYSFLSSRKKGWYKRESTAHTIALHVNISDAQLRQRANDIGEASKFYSLLSAEWAVQYAIDHMGQAKADELAKLEGDPFNAGKTVDITVDTGEIIGYGYVSGNPNIILEAGVKVVFMIGYNGSPFVLTAFPVEMQPPPPPPHAPGHGFAP